MLKIRVMPCLLLRGTGLVKTVRFQDPVYVGDPMNAVRIFNQKQAHELVLLDITAGSEGRAPNVPLLTKAAEECHMPLTVGGGIRTLEQIRSLLNAGVEKVVINTQALEQPDFVSQAAAQFGSQAIVVSLDARKTRAGYEIFTHRATRGTGVDPVAAARRMQACGAGEILLNAVDQDGMMNGYDLDLIRRTADVVDIPLIAVGGAGKVADFTKAVEEGHASAVAAGSLFVFHGPRRAVLIHFPTRDELETALNPGGPHARPG